jgi:hypothetical protein
MCLVQSNVRGIANWNWDGDVIVHRPIVPSSRPVVGTTSGNEYDIDVREFLVTENNAMIQKTLREDISDYIKTLPGGDLNLFQSKQVHSFDYRAFVISSYVSENIAYKSKKGEDPWQFPDETLFLKCGDCEDRAFLIASLLIGAGISPYNIRVALGKIKMSKGYTHREFDHMWVMYKNEEGRWMLIEPLKSILSQKKQKKISAKQNRLELKNLVLQESPATAEYYPAFLFNDRHLWAVTDYKQRKSFDDLLSLRKKWKKFNPKFAGEVHQNILHAALAGVDQRILNALDQYFSPAIAGLFGPTVDYIDRGKYNPLDHFDNGYVKEGWDLVEERLRIFRTHNTRHLDKFAHAAHAIADFYAHSSYAHFAKINTSNKNSGFDYVELYDNKNPQFEKNPVYTSAEKFDLTSGKFSVNSTYWDINKRPRTEIAKRWGGKIISGRYAQENDTQPGLLNAFIEGLTYIPEEFLKKKDAKGRPDFPDRGSLPHHNEIAVDESTMSSEHKLYSNKTKGRTDRMSFKNQFKWRKNSAIRHVRKIFEENWNLIPLNLTPLP